MVHAFGAPSHLWFIHYGAPPQCFMYYGVAPHLWSMHIGAPPHLWFTHYGAPPHLWSMHFGAPTHVVHALWCSTTFVVLALWCSNTFSFCTSAILEHPVSVTMERMRWNNMACPFTWLKSIIFLSLVTSAIYCLCYKSHRHPALATANTEWISDNSCDTWNFPANQAITVQMCSVLHLSSRWTLTVFSNHQEAASQKPCFSWPTSFSNCGVNSPSVHFVHPVHSMSIDCHLLCLDFSTVTVWQVQQDLLFHTSPNHYTSIYRFYKCVIIIQYVPPA